MHDLTIVGAGPVGSYLASLCAKKIGVTVLEEDSEAGKKSCSGLVSPRLMEMLPQAVKKSGLVEHMVKGAIIHFMGKEFEFRKSGTAAYVLDRDALDKRLADYALSKGAEIRYGEKALSVSFSRDCASVKTARHVFESKMLAGCDGARSVVSRSLGSKPNEVLNGIIAYTDVSDNSDNVEMWFDKSLVKDGFFWKIPRGDQTEFGCIGHALSFPVLKKFFSLDDKVISGRSASPVPVGIAKTYADRTILVGDAACQTKPWSGGGITYGMIAAKCAAETICKASEKGKFDGFYEYESLWKEKLYEDIRAGIMMREFYKDLELKALGSIMDRIESMKHKGDDIDFDFPVSSIMKMGGFLL